MTVKQIWNNLDKGETVNWHSELYEVRSDKSNGSKYAKFSERNGYSLRIECTSNSFGSYLSKNDLEYII